MASSAADSQTIYSNSTICEYDVHICYNGPGIEDNFISHLQDAFKERGIKTTNDDGWNIRGEDVSQTTLEAIEKARSSVLVFCENFPSKTRCLDELDKVLECEKKGQLVRVIYFRIDQSVVQNLGGSYGAAMAGYRERFKNERIKVVRWEVSLYDAAHLPWRTYKNGCQSEFIQEFVAELSGILNPTSLCSAGCLAGLKSRITEPQNLLDSISRDVDTVGRIRGRGAPNLPKAAGLKPFFTISHRKEPENGGRFIADQPSTSTGNATRKRKWISIAAEFSDEANAPQEQILIPRKLKGSVEAFSASVGVGNSTLLAIKDAGTVARTSEEVKSAMQTVQTYASKSFHELFGEGSEFKEHIEENVLRFRADEKISQGMCVVLDSLLRNFTCWSQYYERASTVLEATAAGLSKADKLQADFEAVVNDSEKAISAEKEVHIQLDHKLRQKRELEQELEAVKSEIADLSSSRQEVALRKSFLLDEGTKLKAEKDNLIVQLPRIMGEQVAAKFTQEYIEAEWLKHVEVFNEIFKSEFGCS